MENENNAIITAEEAALLKKHIESNDITARILKLTMPLGISEEYVVEVTLGVN